MIFKDASNALVLQSDNQVPKNRWVHVAGTWNGSVAKLYIDYQLVKSETYTVPMSGSSNPVIIGWRSSNTTAASANTIIDEVRISDSELQPSSFINTSNVNGSIPTDSLIAYYPFNNNTNDESGSGKNGTQNNIIFSQNRFGISNKSAYFNGTTSYISLPGTWGGQSELTISSWVKTADTNSGYYAIVSSPSWAEFLHFQIYNNSPGAGIYTSPTMFDLINANIKVQKNQWTHLVLVIKSGATTMYKDGVIVSQSSQTFTTLTTSSNVKIGRGYSSERFFYGGIDDVRIYKRALNSSEIQLLYHEGGW